MAASDARPVPRKNTAWRVYFAIRKNDGTLITTWTGQDSEVSLDGAAFADCTNEATEVGMSGCGYLDLTSAEMNADEITLKITVTNTDALPLVLTVFPEEAGDYRLSATPPTAVQVADEVQTRTIARVTLVDTTTTNTDMRGTNNAALAATALSTATWTSEKAGFIDAAISTRMATYVQPTGFLAATFPSDPADQSLIIEATDAILTAVGTRLATASYTAPPSVVAIADAVWDEARTGHTTAGTFGFYLDAAISGVAAGSGATAQQVWEYATRGLTEAVELDPAARVKLDATQPDYAPATVAALAAAKAILDKIDTGLVLDGAVYQFTANMLELAPTGGGGTDWTASERTAIRSILGVPTSGTTPADPTTGILDTIRDSVATYIAGIATSASLTPGTIVGFPATLTIGDSYTDDCDSAIHVFIRDENDDPITAVGTHDFTDGDFAPECIITQNGNTGRVKCEVTYVAASPENYLKIQIPSKESRRATAGIATVQVLLKWDGAQKALSKQAVTWDGLI